ncbi:unnamed protein product [Rotaria magnacalcarata]|uniref:Uncharacterized protein n=1 Tax=Rotaria magnacalcarata TaxID=392030 RepID=A0A815TVU1_9BILA|nr:unnamed protein product [Rotaria magnacalcarata]CAF1513688.1 unnamed protein product [Rotaria magnacalcarata]CAF2073521.1 unnamed protein product [Rotaria magnacalcarata]
MSNEELERFDGFRGTICNKHVGGQKGAVLSRSKRVRLDQSEASRTADSLTTRAQYDSNTQETLDSNY